MCIGGGRGGRGGREEGRYTNTGESLIIWKTSFCSVSFFFFFFFWGGRGAGSGGGGGANSLLET